jgi:hypothetical protein
MSSLLNDHYFVHICPYGMLPSIDITSTLQYMVVQLLQRTMLILVGPHKHTGTLQSISVSSRQLRVPYSVLANWNSSILALSNGSLLLSPTERDMKLLVSTIVRMASANILALRDPLTTDFVTGADAAELIIALAAAIHPGAYHQMAPLFYQYEKKPQIKRLN